MANFDFEAGIISAGAFGTAIAQAIGYSEKPVLLWSPEKDVIASINKDRVNPRYVPHVPLCENLTATSDLEEVVRKCRVLFVCCPANANTEIAAAIHPLLTDDHIVVITSKGFRQSDGALLSDVWKEIAPNFKNIAILSGPSFAVEAAAQKVTAVTIAADDPKLVKAVNSLFKVDWFRLYFSDDMAGVQIGGALKNVVAIAAGMADGLEMGANARSAIICRGLAEMARYGKAYGAKETTFLGLSGLGDVMLTATSPLSRNYRFGFELGRGMSQEKARKVADNIEGIRAARIATAQAVSRGVDMGVIMMVDGVLQGDMTPARGMELLASRPRINEFEEQVAPRD